MSNKTKSSKQLQENSIQLTKAVKSLVKSFETHAKSFDSLQNTIKDIDEDLDLRIESKEKKMKELDEEYERNKKGLKIELDQEIKAYGYEKAVSLLADKKEIPVDVKTYELLKAELKELKETLEDQVKTAVNKVRGESKVQLSRELKTKDLEFNAKQAQIEAELKQKDREIDVLQGVIKDLKMDLDKQRDLTGQVAEASKPQYVPYQSNK